MALYEIGIRFVGPEPDDPLIREFIQRIKDSNQIANKVNRYAPLIRCLIELSNEEMAGRTTRIEAHIAFMTRYSEKPRRRKHRRDGTLREKEIPSMY